MTDNDDTMTTPITHLPDGRPRGRGLDLPFADNCGANNALTDVAGVEVGYTTLISGEGERKTGQGPVRTGVTAILPRGRGDALTPVWSGMFSLNGNGEMTGTHWIRETGQFQGPVCITNTHSVGIAHHAAVRWITRQVSEEQSPYTWVMPVVAETCDAHLNDMNGLHVTEADVIDAIESSRSGPLDEGNVGGGTGMICYEFKGGTGTASRIVEIKDRRYTLGAMVQANFGMRSALSVLGVPVGQRLTQNPLWSNGQGSIIAVVGTDAPLMPVQLQRIARRIALGVGRTGTASEDGSGDIFLAFSTANAPSETNDSRLPNLEYLPNDRLNPLFAATVETVEESIINALVAAKTMTGADNNEVVSMDHDRLQQVMREYGRLL